MPVGFKLGASVVGGFVGHGPQLCWQSCARVADAQRLSRCSWAMVCSTMQYVSLSTTGYGQVGAWCSQVSHSKGQTSSRFRPASRHWLCPYPLQMPGSTTPLQVRVGAAVGIDVGSDAVGISLGLFDGAAVGSLLAGERDGLRVGAAVGAEVVGPLLGEGDGGEVGSAVGPAVGDGVGDGVGIELEGFALGSVEGAGVGPAVGVADGRAVLGAGVGIDVGAAVGPGDGTAVGSGDGELVGPGDGWVDGGADGAPVGARVDAVGAMVGSTLGAEEDGDPVKIGIPGQPKLGCSTGSARGSSS